MSDPPISKTEEEVEGQEEAKLGPAPTSKQRKLHHDDNPSTTKDADPVASSSTAGPSQVMPLGRPLPLFICSIGNPGNHHANTLHSAGHTLLNALAERLGYSNFHKEKALGNGSVTYPTNADETGGGQWTLWQSPSYMNESGKSVRAAYMAWTKNLADSDGKLVIIHDELEKPLGAVSLRTAQGASAKGHNGLKSIMSLMGQTPFSRIGIGIGRPASRQSDDVARYVLRKMDLAEKAAVEGAVDQVITKLKELERG